jgi:NADP-dependent alcohol dehydrogenase
LIPAGLKIMMIYGGGSIKKNGIYDQVIKALYDRDIIEFGGIEPNPHYETCMKAVEIARNKKVQFLLAVGGGSVLDATKFIAAAAKYQGDDPWQICRTRGQVVTAALPLGCVMTVPATGSEMNMIAVISNVTLQEKLALVNEHVYPQFSILDPETTYSLSQKQLRNGIADTFSHVVEQYITYDVQTPLQDRQAEAILNTLIELTPRIMNREPDYEARAGFFWCATQALNGLISCGGVKDFASHQIGHELTAFFGIDHAESLAVVMPALWRHQKENKKQKLVQFAERVWNINEGSNNQKAEAAITKTVEFFHSVNMPTSLADYNITHEATQKVVDRFAQRKTKLGERQIITAQEIGEILKMR